MRVYGFALAGLLLATLVSFGQGCQQFSGAPGTKVEKSGGNGSGYGGLTPRPDGSYSPEFVGSTRGGTEVFTDNYFRFGETALCSPAPTAMGETGPFVNGRVFYNDSFFIQPDLCATPVALDFSKINFVPFNKEVFVIEGLVYEFYKNPPQLLSQIRYHQAHCRALDGASGGATGFVANVFRLDGQYYAEVFRGVQLAAGGNMRYKVDAFPVTRTVAGSAVTYQASGFSLVVEGQGSAAAASLQLNWSGEAIGRSATCW